MKRILCWIRSFKTLDTIEEVNRLKLHFIRNVFGDEINQKDCRSLWNDDYWNVYKCNELKSK
jgi:hypothetical protein